MTAGELQSGLSAVRNADTAAWWFFAGDEDAQERAPEFLRPLLRGEVRRVRASRVQIDEALRWAEGLSGWEPVRGIKPLRVFDLGR